MAGLCADGHGQLNSQRCQIDRVIFMRFNRRERRMACACPGTGEKTARMMAARRGTVADRVGSPVSESAVRERTAGRGDFSAGRSAG